MPIVIEERQSGSFDEDMAGATEQNTTPNKKTDTSVQIENDIDKGNQVVYIPPKDADESANEEKEVVKLINNKVRREEADPEQPRKARCCRHRKIWFILSIIASLILGIVGIVLTQTHRHPPDENPSPVNNFHHAFFHLKTMGYEKLDDVTSLQWMEDDSQNVGNIKLIDGCYFYIPQDGIYQINFAVQLHIPKDTPASVITLMLQRKNNEKDYVFMKKTSSSLNIPEHEVIQSSFRYKLKAGDRVFLRMNMVKFISRNKHSSYLYISRLNTNISNNDQ